MKYNRIKCLITGHESPIVFFSLLFFWFAVLMLSGKLWSGYHLIDDVEILRISDQIKALNSFASLKSFVYEYFSYYEGRFFPFYQIHKLFKVIFFGTEIFYWHIYQGFLFVLTSFFLFSFLRKIDFSIFESLTFALFTLLGIQSVLWIDLGRADALGTFLLSVSLLFMGLSAKRAKNIYKILFLLSAFLMSLTKESFILVLPALAFWNIWIIAEKENISFIDSIKKNKLVSFGLLAIFTAEIFYILTFLKADIGYVGISDFRLLDYLKELSFITFKVNPLNLLLIIYLSIFLVYESIKKTNNHQKKNLLKYFYLITLFVLILVPQMILYAKSGFWPRFLLPALISFSIIAVYLLKFLRESKSCIIFKNLVKLTICLSILASILSTYTISTISAYKGLAIKKILQIIKQKQGEHSKIILVTDPVRFFEEINSLVHYINTFTGNKNIKLIPMRSTNIYKSKAHREKLLSSFYKGHKSRLTEEVASVGNAQFIIVFRPLDKLFEKNSKFFSGSKDYNKILFINFALYYVD